MNTGDICQSYSDDQTPLLSREKASAENDTPNQKNRVKICRNVYGRLFPLGIRNDAKEILSITGWMTATQIGGYLLSPISLIFAGKLGTIELASVALAQSVINITANSVMFGLVNACDTFMSNAFGSNRRGLIGIYLQRAMYICPLFCFLCWAVQINSKPILLALHQDPVVSEKVENFLIALSPGVLFVCYYQVLMRYLINQRIILPNLVIAVIGNAGSAVFQSLFTFGFQWNITGIAVAQALGYFMLASFTLGYIICWKAYVSTWNGFRLFALEDWWPFIKLALSGLVMICIKWWIEEMGIILTGSISKSIMSATSISFIVGIFFYMLPLSFAVAASVRVGNFLGKGDAARAKSAANVCQLVAVVCAAVEAVLILSFLKVIPVIFTTNKHVVNMIESLLPIFVAIVFLWSITAVTGGIFYACGKQFVGLLINFIGYCCTTIPLTVVFLYVNHWNVYGFCLAYCFGVFVTALICFIYQFTIQWDQETVKALERLAITNKNSNIRSTTDIQEEYFYRGHRKTLIKRIVFAAAMMSVFIISLVFRSLRHDLNKSNSTHLNNSIY